MHHPCPKPNCGASVRVPIGNTELATSRVARIPQRLTTPEPDTASLPRETRVVLPTMSYLKKDEDADTGLVKLDRTQVFQEGEQVPPDAVRRRQQELIVADIGCPQPDSLTARLFSRADVASFSPRSPCFSIRARSSLPSRPPPSSSASRSCSRTKMPVCARWSTWSSRSWPALLRTPSW